MSSPRAVVTAVVAWLAVVAVGSTVVWLVISRAGAGITPATGPGITPPSTAPPTPGGPRSTPPATPAATDRPTAQRRTWQGAGGLVTAECRGARITLVATSADAGFVVEPESRGPDEVRVKFEGQGDEGRETSVRARCSGGAPEFEAETRDD
ncbi:MAG TPA: hypothetical protein VFT70_00865 [Nocardioides sp.]|nr:hypothetical protein [Nocardioides sp.]